MKISNIEDVTDSPKDWEDFWNGENLTDDEIEYLKTRSKYYFDIDETDQLLRMRIANGTITIS